MEEIYISVVAIMAILISYIYVNQRESFIGKIIFTLNSPKKNM